MGTATGSSDDLLTGPLWSCRGLCSADGALAAVVVGWLFNRRHSPFNRRRLAPTGVGAEGAPVGGMCISGARGGVYVGCALPATSLPVCVPLPPPPRPGPMEGGV